MYTPLVLVLLLALLFDLAAATSPTLESPLPTAPMEPFYPDPEGILDAICELCGISMDYCVHALTIPQRAPMFTAEIFYGHPEWPQESLPVLDEPAPEPAPPIPYVTEADRQPLVDAVIQRLNDNATTIQPSTVQIHVEGTYTPGDRLQAATQASSRRPHRRQPPRPGGFPCAIEGCGRVFDRACDLKRHQKTHLGRSERPHKCSVCNEGFLYPKDRNRHQSTHDQSPSPQATLYCNVPGCANVDGFSRRDNLLRHQRKQHPGLAVTP